MISFVQPFKATNDVLTVYHYYKKLCHISHSCTYSIKGIANSSNNTFKNNLHIHTINLYYFYDFFIYYILLHYITNM